MLGTAIKNCILIILIILIIHFFIKNFLEEQRHNKENFVDTIKTSEIKQQNELLNYINTDEKTLDNLFKNNIVTDPVKNIDLNENKCNKKQNDIHYPISTTCDNNITPIDNKDNKKEINEDIIQNKKNMTILKSYEDESPLNSGKLYGGILQAYDPFDIQYSMYANCE